MNTLKTKPSDHSVISRGNGEPMPISDHEEADSRMCLHLLDAVEKGARSLIVRTVDTDVVVILVGIFSELTEQHPDVELWVAFGTGKNFRHYHINSICRELGNDKSKALPFFHAYTGSDTTSQFHGHAKKSSWEAWMTLPSITESFLFPVDHPFQPLSVESPVFEALQHFTCILYDNATSCTRVNDLRQELFPRKIQMMQNLPPSQEALIQHTNRSLYQASIWLTSLQTMQNAPSPDGFGWIKKETTWEPFWSILPDAAKTCRELIKCGCKAVPLCTRRCTCKSTGLECTALCLCKGNCAS